jgi:two-component system chemotaxis response regulator CheB
MDKIKVLIVDDSAFARKMLTQMISNDSGIEVVGTAMDGIFALNKIPKLKPDVVTLDINMPRMDGIEALQRIIEEFGLQVIIVSSHTKRDADLSIKALEMGAFDLVAKPEKALTGDLVKIEGELVEKIKAAGKSPLAHSRIKKVKAEPVRKRDEVVTHKRPAAERVLAIGTSTGGPNALTYMLPNIPKDFPAAILIVQHMPKEFVGMFAARLNNVCQIEVKEAQDGDLVLPGRALIAPGNRHLEVKRKPLGVIAVTSDSPPVSGHKPSVDVLFQSVADEYGKVATGLIMTGMGHDGSDGIGDIAKSGGITVAQDEDSCVVFGMPKAAIAKKHIKCIVSLEDMATFLIKHFAGKEVKHGTVSC